MDTSEIVKHFTPDEALTLPDLWYNSARAVSSRVCSQAGVILIVDSLGRRLYGESHDGGYPMCHFDDGLHGEL